MIERVRTDHANKQDRDRTSISLGRVPELVHVMHAGLVLGSLILLMRVGTTAAQVGGVVSFPTEAIWRVDVNCIWHNCFELYSYQYRLGADTLINGEVYTQVLRDSVVVEGIGGPPCWLFPWAFFTGYRGAIREDTVANKVYGIWAGETNESLFYDYTLGIGQAIVGLASGCTMTVSGIDSVLVNGEYRKRWHFMTCYEGPGYIIEGIGSDNGLIERLDLAPGFCSGSLICVRDDQMAWYESGAPSTYGCQEVIARVPVVDPVQQASFHPNPFRTTTRLVAEGLDGASLILTNSLGQTVPFTYRGAGTFVEIDRSGLPSGAYWVKVMKQGRWVATHQLMIIDP